jgi:hypothetical protein
MSTRTLMAAALVVAIAIVGGWFMKHRSAEKDPQAAEREREAQFSKAREDRERNADWGKTQRDARRMEEISRRRAEEQRERTQAK